MTDTTALTLRFTRWECGHHCTRPNDIKVQTAEQALQICLAIAFAISQPGSAMAVVMEGDRYFEVYISDDTISVGRGHSGQSTIVPERHHWDYRPRVICGSANDIEALHNPELAGAVDNICCCSIERLEQLKYVEDDALVTSTLSQEEVERMAAPIDWYESDGRKRIFGAPPVFLRAEELLAELRAEKAADDAYQAELAAEAAAHQAAL